MAAEGKNYDVIVIGCGAVGSAAMLHLAKAGRRVLGIDRFQPPHRFGSTHGETRITRAAIGEGVDYTPLARVIMRQTFLQAVKNRLNFQDFLKRHPAVRDTKIERPIFVLGFPRTGTTALQNLMCLDPGRRGLRFWELTTPVPWHDNPALDEKWRIRNAERTLRAA